jgi:uracil-DNA glycosylase
MAVTDPIEPDASAPELLEIIQDFSHYLWYQKTLGFTQCDLSSESRAILASWEQKLEPSLKFHFQGPSGAHIVLVDSNGSFFSGDAGKLLTKILAAMKILPGDVSICNAPDSVSVQNHVLGIRPNIVIALGDRAAGMMTGRQEPLAQFRGRFFDFQGIAVMPTFHPLQLLDDPALKRPVWEDMQQVMKRMEPCHAR